MEELAKTRTWLSVSIGIIITLIVFMLLPSQTFKPSGIVLPSQQQRKPSKTDQVVFYANDPADMESLGTISIMRHYRPNSRAIAQKEIFAYAKKLAAATGGNGVVVTLFAHSVPGAGPSAQAIYAFKGKVIYSNGMAQPSFTPLSFQTNPFE